MHEQDDQARQKGFVRRHKWLFLGTVILTVLVAGGGAWLALTSTGKAQEGKEAPEAQRVLALQAKMPFQMMIPAYLPEGFDRENARIVLEAPGPVGEPMTELTYEMKDGASLTVREWVPPDPKLEVLANSRPIKTKWGKGWLLTHINLSAVWSDIGPTRVSVFTPSVDKISREQLLAVAESLGPPSNNQVFTFLVDKPVIKDAPTTPPFRPRVNAQGVQEFTLVITPGGYDPLRIELKRGVPVRMTFRQLGEVGCGNTLLFPTDPQNPSSVTLKSEQDKQVIEFTPNTAGQFTFYCAHQMYRGALTVTDK